MNIVDFEKLKKELDVANKNIKLLKKSQSEIDKLDSVLAHQVENNKFNACEGYLYLKKLQEIAIKRRIIKEQLVEQQCIANKLKPFIDSYSMTKKNIEDAKALIERANSGDADAKALLEKATNTDEYKSIMGEE